MDSFGTNVPVSKHENVINNNQMVRYSFIQLNNRLNLITLFNYLFYCGRALNSEFGVDMCNVNIL